jgi:4-hydroxybenzoate polyprenyltransferase
MVTAGTAAAAAALALAFLLDWQAGALVLIATVTGLLYSVRLIPRRWKPILHFRRLKDIPSSKDIFVGIAWSAVTVLVPALHAGIPILSISVITSLLGIFTLTYIRSVLLDIREIGGDRIVGKESLPTLIGSARSEMLIAALILLALAIFATAPAIGLLPPAGLLLLPALLYLGMLLLAFVIYAQPLESVADPNGVKPARRWSGLAIETMIDFVFILAGLIGLMALNWF